ncbi:MAG: YeeE/YedE thiosulfate transporter family protein [Pseudomonadota bacterium]
MPLDTETLIYIVSLLLAAIIGYAIHRGSTCAVNAVAELVLQGRPRRFLSFLLCSAVVALVLLPAAWSSTWRWEGLLPVYSASWLSIAGGALFGVGAVVNGACNFGTINRLGCGDTQYLFLFPGLFVGAAIGPLLGFPHPGSATSFVDHVTPVAIGWIMLCVAMAVVFAFASIQRKRARGTPGRPIAFYLSIIGLLGALITLAVGPWHYTRIAVAASSNPSLDVLVEIAPLAGLLAAVVAGSVFAGIRKRTFKLCAPTLMGSLSCLAGGALMGAAILLVPGGNDGMVFSGIPSLSPSTAIAYPAMCLTIAILVWVPNRLSRKAAAS